MLINLSAINFQYNNKNTQIPGTVKLNLAPLAYDTVSFSGKKINKLTLTNFSFLNYRLFWFTVS